MGCDIHGVFQRRVHSEHDTDTWEFISSTYNFDRHYQLFAVLANVRNGYGFAGTPTGDEVIPISEPRGLPEDWPRAEDWDEVYVPSIEFTSPWNQKCVQEHPDWYKDPGENPLRVWLGDHSHSWLSAKEMLAWYEIAPTVTKCGVISKAEYEAWGKKSCPKEYCGMISGHGILVVDHPDANAPLSEFATHVRVYWQQGLKEELSYFFDEILRLQTEYEDVRFVFGFDS